MPPSDDPKRAAEVEVIRAALELVRIDDGAAFVRLRDATRTLLRLGWGEQLTIGGAR